ncbi:MAG: P-loop NTPase [Thaumarchaeota archaeon]|nr:P-loop NTPase [Nitrososphaerota archaeon]
MAKILAVVGGKGGTGKTLLALNLAYGLSKLGKTLLIDVDVDNPCSKTFLRAEPSSREVVKEFRPRIIEDRCRLCGVCVQNCHSHALILIPGKRVMLSSELCEGCGVCRLVCPFKAIEDSWIEAGHIEEYRMDYGFDAIVGELKPTTRRTPVMILKTLRYAEKRIGEYDYAVADSPPGTGSGIYAIMSYADLIIAVTEPTRLGLSDLEKLYKLYEKTGSKRLLVAINKSGLRGGVHRELEKFLEEIGVEWIEIPYDESVVRSYAEGSILIEKYPRSPAAEAVKKILERVSEILS